jgi:hypothetical protein
MTVGRAMRLLSVGRLRWAALGAIVAVLAAGAVGYTASAGAVAAADRSQAATGTLNMNARLRLVSKLGPCPPGVEAGTCAERTSRGPFPGLGEVAGTYTFRSDLGPPCANGWGKARAYPVRFTIASKGDILFQLAEGAECVNEADFAVRAQTQAFTITGGTGIYAGASGTGTVSRSLRTSDTGSVGTETWTGILTVAGLEFDVTPPTLVGASNRTVRAKKGAKSARVTFRVTAQDGTDGVVSAACNPRSGSRFQLGRTRVACEATDSSGNAATAVFRVTVRPTR